jgi:hypothetical protein
MYFYAMAVKSKKPSKKSPLSTHRKTEAIVSAEVGSYEKHPFFVKKANDAKAFLLKVGLPKKLAKKS